MLVILPFSLETIYGMICASPKLTLPSEEKSLGPVCFPSHLNQASSREPGCLWPGRVHAGSLVWLHVYVEPGSD
jgi:hypothetical protein